MTGERIKRIQKNIDADPFMVTYADRLADLDISHLIEYHKSHGKLATVAAVRPGSRFGSVALDKGGTVKQFMEKPRAEGWISSGLFVFGPGVLNYLGRDSCILERDRLENLATGGQLKAFRHYGIFYTMDTCRDYQYLNELWFSGRAPWKAWS